jgi:hypothetical protein
MWIWQKIKYLEQKVAHLEKQGHDEYWENKHSIWLIQDYLGVTVVKPDCKEKLVKKGGPESNFQ